jgi:hypothetical protein
VPQPYPIGITLWHVPQSCDTRGVGSGEPMMEEMVVDTVPMDVADLIRRVNASNEAVEDQCLRACQAAEIATQSARAVELSVTAAESATVAYRTVQAEHPRRCASLPRQVTLALITVALDGVACYFAAQALDGSQDATWVWTGLFLGVLAVLEVALDFYRDRNLRVWKALVALAGIFVALLGVLRFWFLATIGTDGLVPAITGAFLFTAATAGFLCLGYRALRVAETPQTWRARRAAGKAWQAARAAHATANRDAGERDRLILAYIGHVRKLVLKTYPADVQVALESAVRSHLADRCNLGEGAARSAVHLVRGPDRYPHSGSLRLQDLPQPRNERAHGIPACHPHLGTGHYYQPSVSVSDASRGSARSLFGAPAGTGHHLEFRGRSDSGLVAGTGLPRRSGPRFPRGASVPSD